jgi:hypothetical protein
MGELKNCLDFLKKANKFKEELSILWDKNISKLEDPQKHYY